MERRITDPEGGQALPQGKVDMIEVRGPNVFKGYWNMVDRFRTLRGPTSNARKSNSE